MMSDSSGRVFFRVDLFVLAVVAVVAFWVRFRYISGMDVDTPLRGDAGRYFSLALNVAMGNGYSLSSVAPYTPSTYIMPGYPLFLSVAISHTSNFLQSYRLILFIQCMLGAGVCVLVYLLSRRFMSVALSTLAAILTVFSPHLVAGGGYLLTESLFTFVFCLTILVTVYSFDHPSIYKFAFSGVVFGLACLIRPTPFMLLPLLGVAIYKTYMAKTWLHYFLAFVFGAALVLAPWGFWKGGQEVGEEPSLLRATLAMGSYPDLVYRSPAFRGYPYREDPLYKEMSESLSAAAKTIGHRISAEPVKYIAWYLVGKPVMFWSPVDPSGPGGVYIYPTQSFYDRPGIMSQSVSVYMAAHDIFLFLGGIALLLAIRLSIRVGWYEAMPVIAIVVVLVYFTLVHMVLTPLPRYAFPLYPLLFILTAYAVGAGIGLLMRFRRGYDFLQ